MAKKAEVSGDPVDAIFERNRILYVIVNSNDAYSD
ncbi:hypothetical protein PaecuDRAFT_3945 [Paenibacillus curdlanolyticus YK9]|uniref:Uncharacterized protein n=1 Tax=Paenibacillus curdlanolyticus YK9 TaxID=717606 RepID=E0IE54_9BACL|nr:hypothetical protein PaecuDRAFT_3945 [Paenibacillus curdlanolyticus YK9]